MSQTMIIIQSGGGLEQYSDHANNLLYQYYENSPSALIDIPLSAEELGDITYYNIIACQSIPTPYGPSNPSIGK